MTKVVPRSLPLGNNQGTETSQRLTIIYNYIVARYGCVQKNLAKINNMLTARINPLTVCFILCLAIEATYEPEFCFSLFLIGGGGGGRTDNSFITNIIGIICRILLPAAPG